MSGRVGEHVRSTASGRRLQGALVYLLPFVVLIVTWHLLASSGRFPRNFLPTPMAVLAAIVELAGDGRLARDISDSLGRLALGIVISVAMGLVFGVVMGLNRGLAEFFEPLCSFLNAMSGIAWIPLALVLGAKPLSWTIAAPPRSEAGRLVPRRPLVSPAAVSERRWRGRW